MMLTCGLKDVLGTKELLEEGFSNRQITFMAEEGYLEKVCLSDPRAVICMNSALYF